MYAPLKIVKTQQRCTTTVECGLSMKPPIHHQLRDHPSALSVLLSTNMEAPLTANTCRPTSEKSRCLSCPSRLTTVTVSTPMTATCHHPLLVLNEYIHVLMLTRRLNPKKTHLSERRRRKDINLNLLLYQFPPLHRRIHIRPQMGNMGYTLRQRLKPRGQSMGLPLTLVPLTRKTLR